MTVSRVAEHLQVHRSTISRLLARHRATGSVRDRPRSGRPRVTTQRQDRLIRLQHLRNRQQQATETARTTPGRHNNRISAQTVRNRLRRHGLRCRRPYRGPPLTAVRRQNRLQWCNRHLAWTQRMWNQVLFTDESRFRLSHSDGRVRVYRRPGERYSDAAVVEHDRWGGPSVMVWAGIAFNCRTELVVLDGNLTGQRYRDEVLDAVTIPFMRRHQHLAYLQQDNARPHVARIVQAYLQTQQVQTLPWPAFSPDLSPIEHAWDELERRVQNRPRQAQNARQLTAALVEEWRAIPADCLQMLVRSMRSRITACIQARGGHTRY